MSYLTQPAAAGRRSGLVVVGLLHVALGYALVSGLAVDWVSPPPAPTPPIVARFVPRPPEPKPLEPDFVEPRPVARAPDLRFDVPPAPNAPRLPDPPRLPDVPARPPLVGPVGDAVRPPPTQPPVLPPRPDATVRTPAVPSPRNLITPDDYPPAARRAEQEGVVAVAYRVDPDGRVRDCVVEAGSGHAALDRATCAIIERRFRFTPAREDARAVAQARTQTVRWTLIE